MELAAQYYAADPKIGKIIAWVGFRTPDVKADSHSAATKLIQSVADKNPDRAAPGQPMITLAWQAKRKFREAEPKKTTHADSLAIEAEKAFDLVVKESPIVRA